MSAKAHILIAGGGIGGLTAAISLLKSGYKVTVLEQARSLEEIGAGIQLSPNATRLLIGLGLLPKLDPIAYVAREKYIRLYETGETFKLFDLGEVSLSRYGAPLWMMHRADLHAALVAGAQGLDPDCIQTSARIKSFKQHAGHVTADIEDGRKFIGDLLVGADGIQSTVRHFLHGDMNINFVGRAAWRGVVPASAVPQHLREPVSTNWVGPGANANVYPIRKGEYINFVGGKNDVEWTSESWTERGSSAELMEDFRGWHSDVQAIISKIETPLKWAFRGRTPLTNWSQGLVTLLGDAAHPMLPTLGQGSCMAIEDGVILTRCLEESSSIESALRTYERTRIQRTTAAMYGSTENARRLQDPKLGGPDAAAFLGKEYRPEAVQSRYDWIFNYDALTVPLVTEA